MGISVVFLLKIYHKIYFHFVFFPVILLHAATRKRNIKNKFANVVDLFKEDVTPMTIILSKICTIEDENSEYREK